MRARIDLFSRAADRATGAKGGDRVDLAAFRALRTPAGAAALRAVTGRDVGAAGLLATLGAMRADHPEPLVSAAVTQVRLRERARPKFGPDAGVMFFTPDGVEQATRGSVGRHRAARLAAAGPDRVLDLCCGIGGDLIAFARAGFQVHGVDADPLTAAVAQANVDVLGLAATVECARAADVPLPGWPAVFCDPARRHGGRRVFDPRGYSPPVDAVLAICAAVPLAVAKLGPGIPHHLVPAGVEAEWVSEGGTVLEAALWFGPLATTTRRATLLPAGHTLTDEALDAAPVGTPGRWLYEPDGAVIRAHLVAEVAARIHGWLLDPTIAYITADSLIDTPFARAYEVTDVMPFSLKRLRALLRDREVGRVTIKKRGSAIDPAQLRQALRPAGPAEATVVLTRVAGAPTTLICRPAPAPAGGLK